MELFDEGIKLTKEDISKYEKIEYEIPRGIC